ncbi:MAG TPA: hypothetical protein VFP12_13995 [Allosphingosinicella sp.]|nr:hypothetical protein [Allosphingosinicella sp.]
MTEAATGEAELFIHLDLEGLAALMKAIEAAMANGRGCLSLGSGSGSTVADSFTSHRFEKVTVTFADPPGPSDDAGWTAPPDPECEARGPVLQMRN